VLATAATFTIEGVRSREITVEVDLRQGLPAFTVVGLPDTAVREARERVRAAMLNSGLEFPQKRVTANLAPAYLRKTGATFDLGLAVALLAASGQIPHDALHGCAVCGELSLSGSLRRVGGAVAIAFGARDSGLTRLFMPAASAPEAALVDGIDVIGVESLGELVAVLTGLAEPAPARPAAPAGAPEPATGLDLADVRGQPDGKRALEIAAAGGHSLLMIGPPGAGKTMLARRLPGILPSPSFAEAVEITNIRSIAGLGGGLAAERPFRAPHHTVSASGLVGGGSRPRPGEVTLAHRGVLFLDELPEFSRSALEALRQPLEDGHVVVTRGQRTIEFPAATVLVAALNPCPCGRSGEECSCTMIERSRYRRRLSGPLLDRIDLVCELGPARLEAVTSSSREEGSPDVRMRVVAARERQAERLRSHPATCNGDMGGPLTRRVVRLQAAAAQRLHEGHVQLGLSARGHDRVLRIARTIADLEGAEKVATAHVDEALGYRMRPTLSEAA
jgi:magnesium chelatase family protein